MPDEVIETQWGSQARTFRNLSDDEKFEGLAVLRRLADQIIENTGCHLAISYGTLLGSVRTGQIISHDFDFDFAFFPRSLKKLDVYESALRIVEVLADSGQTVTVQSNGQFSTTIRVGDTMRAVDFFAGWVEGGRVFQYFALGGEIDRGDYFPLSRSVLGGIPFPCPRRPTRILRALYGENWQTPDSGFKFETSQETWKQFEFLFASRKLDERKTTPDWPVAVIQAMHEVVMNEFLNRDPADALFVEIGEGANFTSLQTIFNLSELESNEFHHCEDQNSSSFDVNVARSKANLSDVWDVVNQCRRWRQRFDLVVVQEQVFDRSPMSTNLFVRRLSQIVKPRSLLILDFDVQRNYLGIDSKSSSHNLADFGLDGTLCRLARTTKAELVSRIDYRSLGRRRTLGFFQVGP